MKLSTMKPMRVIALALVAAALLLALPLQAQKDFNQSEKETVEKYKRARTHFLKGGEHLKKGRMDKARKEAETALEIFPDYAEAHLLLAQLEYQDGRYENALKEVTTAKTDFTTFGKLYSYSYQEYLDRLRQQRDEKQEVINSMAAAVSQAKSNADRMRVESQVSKASPLPWSCLPNTITSTATSFSSSSATTRRWHSTRPRSRPTRATPTPTTT
jgi:tetratricopeptide (TPR) repeat protein